MKRASHIHMLNPLIISKTKYDDFILSDSEFTDPIYNTASKGIGFYYFESSFKQ